jgi:Bacteriophage holin family
MLRTMGKLFTTIEALTGWALGAFLSLVAPVAPFIWLAFGLVLFDTITGTIKAVHAGEGWKSGKMFRFPFKLAVYSVAILASHWVSSTLSPGLPIAWMASCAVAATELRSIYENTRVVSGVNIWQQVKDLLPGGNKRKKGSEEE